MPEGVIKRLNGERGYGFIAADGEPIDLYFTDGSVEAAGFAAVRPGQRVAFIVAPDPLRGIIMATPDQDRAPARTTNRLLALRPSLAVVHRGHDPCGFTRP